MLMMMKVPKLDCDDDDDDDDDADDADDDNREILTMLRRKFNFAA